MKISITQRVAADANLIELLRRIAYQLNQLSEGSIEAKYNASLAAPTTGRWQQGDWIENSNPVELGAPGSKYVINGFKCTVSGSPGTWLQSRALTGN